MSKACDAKETPESDSFKTEVCRQPFNRRKGQQPHLDEWAGGILGREPGPLRTPLAKWVNCREAH